MAMLDSELLAVSQDGDYRKVLGSEEEGHGGKDDDDIICDCIIYD